MAVDLDNLTPEQAGNLAIGLLAVIMKMSDEAEALGGARSLSGVASLNMMQNAIQKNGPKLAKVAKAMIPEDVKLKRRVFLYQVSFTEAGLAFLRETSKMKPNERYQITARGRDETEALLDFNRMCSVRLVEPLRPEHVVLKMIEGW